MHPHTQSSKPLPIASPLVHEKALEMVSNAESKRGIAIDLGTGEGYFAKRLLAKGFSYIVCVDINAQRFKLKHNPFIDLVIADLDHGLPFRSEAFYMASAIEVIEHLFNVKLFIEEVHRILKQAGILILTTPNVEHVLSRLYFLFSGRLYHFWKSYEEHVTPIFSWKLKRLIQDLFVIENVTFNRTVRWPKVPLLRGRPLIPVKSPGKLLGEIWIFRLRKLGFSTPHK